MNSKIVTLKNGAEEPEVGVIAVMTTLNEMNNSLSGMLAFHDIVMRCRDKDYPIADPQLDTLKELGLMGEGGWMHEITRNVVLSAAVGDGMGMQLINPVVG